MKDIRQHESYLLEHEKAFSELTPNEMNQLYSIDKYNLGGQLAAAGFVFEIENETLLEAINTLPDIKRDIVILSYWLNMTDKEISSFLHLVHWTVSYMRSSALKLLKKYLEANSEQYCSEENPKDSISNNFVSGKR